MKKFKNNFFMHFQILQNIIFKILIVVILFNNCGQSIEELEKSNIDVTIINYSKDIFVDTEYTFENEGLNSPIIVRENPTKNEIFVLDRGNICFYVFSKEGKYIRKFSRAGMGPGEMLSPLYFDLDGNGNIYVYEIGNFRISILSQEGRFLKSFRLQYVPQSLPGLTSQFFVSSEGEIIINLPKRGYYITVFDKQGTIIREIGEIPDYLIDSPQANVIFSQGFPFVDEEEKYYIFLESMLLVNIYDKIGNLIREAKFDEIIPDEKYKKLRKNFDPPLKQTDKRIESWISTINEIIYKNGYFYLIPFIIGPINDDTILEINVLDRNLNFVKKLNLPINEGVNRYGHLFLTCEVLSDNKTILIPLQYSSKIFRYKEISENK